VYTVVVAVCVMLMYGGMYVVCECIRYFGFFLLHPISVCQVWLDRTDKRDAQRVTHVRLIYTQALSVAKETYIRINTEGIMCVQHQVCVASVFSSNGRGTAAGRGTCGALG